MKRITTAVLAGATVATLAYASASVLTVTADPLQAGSDSVTCDSDGVHVSWALETTPGGVYWATVDGIDTACEGAQLFLTIDGNDVAPGVTISGPSAQVKFHNEDTMDPELINDVKVFIGS